MIFAGELSARAAAHFSRAVVRLRAGETPSSSFFNLTHGEANRLSLRKSILIPRLMPLETHVYLAVLCATRDFCRGKVMDEDSTAKRCTYDGNARDVCEFDV